MKNRIRFSVLFLSCIFALICLFVSCSGSANPGNPANPDTTSDDKIYYTVTFDSDGGSKVDSQTIESGQKAAKPENPVKEGFDFEGWFIDNQEYSFDSIVTGNFTLKAHWKTIKQETQEPDESQESNESQQQNESQEPNESQESQESNESQEPNESNESQNPNESQEPNEDDKIYYTVTFDSDGGSKVDSQTIENGQKAAKPENPSKEGFEFAGWYIDNNEYNFSESVTSDVIIKAKWNKKGLTNENIVNTIKTLTENKTLKPTGEFSTELISEIKQALTELYGKKPSILVSLDLSETTGLTDSEVGFSNCKNLESRFHAAQAGH